MRVHAGVDWSAPVGTPVFAAFDGEVGTNPVCSGPYRFVERVDQDRIVLEKFPDHRDADNYHFDRLTFLPLPDSTVRLANLRSGDLDFVERMAATDAGTVEADPNLQVLDENIYSLLGFSTRGVALTQNIGRVVGEFLAEKSALDDVPLEVVEGVRSISMHAVKTLVGRNIFPLYRAMDRYGFT